MGEKNKYEQSWIAVYVCMLYNTSMFERSVALVKLIDMSVLLDCIWLFMTFISKYHRTFIYSWESVTKNSKSGCILQSSSFAMERYLRWCTSSGVSIKSSLQDGILTVFTIPSQIAEVVKRDRRPNHSPNIFFGALAMLRCPQRLLGSICTPNKCDPLFLVDEVDAHFRKLLREQYSESCSIYLTTHQKAINTTYTRISDALLN